MTAEDGIIVLSTTRAADDPRVKKGSAVSGAAKQNGAVSHFAVTETELVRVVANQQEPVATLARSAPPNGTPAPTTAAVNGALSTSGAHPPAAQRLPETTPSLHPQLLQRLQSLREALDGQSVQGAQRSAALRAFATLCLACSPPSQPTASQVCAEPSSPDQCKPLVGAERMFAAVMLCVLISAAVPAQAVPPPALLAAAVRTIALAFKEVSNHSHCHAVAALMHAVWVCPSRILCVHHKGSAQTLCLLC